MKQNPETSVAQDVVMNQGVTDSLVLSEMNLDTIVGVIKNEYEQYVPRISGKMDIYTFIGLKMRSVRVGGFHEEAAYYGFSGMKIFEEELKKVYSQIIGNDTISANDRKNLISWVISRITNRKIEWLILMGEHHSEVVAFFDFWEMKFRQNLTTLLEDESKNDPGKAFMDILDREVEDIYRILDGLPPKNSPASL